MNKLNRGFKVNPARRGKIDVQILDHLGREIIRKPGGTAVPNNTFYRRIIKEGDLVKIPDSPRRKPAADTKQKTETKNKNNGA